MMETVALLALPSCLATSISLPLEILNAANDLARANNRQQAKLSLNVISEQPGLINTAGGLAVYASKTPQQIDYTDILILPSLWRNPLVALRHYQWLIPWLQKLARQETTICAVGTSSYFLAEAGLLDNQAATTHWYYCEAFKQRYPKIDVKLKHLITRAGNIYCAGSVNSIADLIIYLVEENYGKNIARQIEAQFSPEIRNAYDQHAYSNMLSSPHHDEDIIEAQELIRRDYQKALNTERLASQLQMSVRTFNRRFKNATGITASEYLDQQRLNIARDLLRTSNLSVFEIASQTGYQDSSYFCARFKRKMNQTPLSYRKSVRGKLFNVS